MLQQDKPNDYVIATGKCYSVKDFLETALNYLGLDYRKYLVIDEKLYRPSEVKILQGDATKARQRLKWSNECSFDALVEDMVHGDLEWYSNQQ